MKTKKRKKNQRPQQKKRQQKRQRRRRKLKQRLAHNAFKAPKEPLLTHLPIDYELAERTRGLPQGGLGVFHLMATRLKLPEAINQHVEVPWAPPALLRVRPYPLVVSQLPHRRQDTRRPQTLA